MARPGDRTVSTRLQAAAAAVLLAAAALGTAPPAAPDPGRSPDLAPGPADGPRALSDRVPYATWRIELRRPAPPCAYA